MYDSIKMKNYLLNINHPQGGPKAKFFIETLGYSSNDGRLLFENIVKSIINKNPIKTENSEHGKRLTFEVKLRGKSGVYIKANVVTVLQQDNGKMTYRIITAFPGRKDSKR